MKKGGAWSSRVAVELKDGRRFERFAEEFKGTPASPLSAEELQTKFMRMAGAHAPAAALHEQLAALEKRRRLPYTGHQRHLSAVNTKDFPMNKLLIIALVCAGPARAGRLSRKTGASAGAARGRRRHGHYGTFNCHTAG